MKKLILTLAAAGAFAAPGLLTAAPSNEKCPVSGKAVDESVVSKHTVVVGFCCGKCQAKFEEDPAAMADKLVEAVGKPVNSTCPISGEEIDDSKTLNHKGKLVAFCCGKCLAKAKDDASTFAEKVKADHPGNEKCPVSGKEVDPEAFVVHTREIGFCCEKCQTKFDADPAKVLKKKDA